MRSIWAKTALLPAGWADSVRITIAPDGTISDCASDASPAGCDTFDTLLPAPVNLHSHAFQRAMAGLTEARGGERHDSFWTWRKLMFRFLDHLTPADIEAITAYAQMEMLESGFACVAEFHYLHHQPGGAPYSNLAEMSERVAAATAESKIGLTLLPVFYQFGGLDERPLSPGQIRFGNTPDRFATLVDGAEQALSFLPADSALGIAPHSLRAVSKSGLAFAGALRPDSPLHIHLAEQVAEVDAVKAHTGQTPVDWLLDHHDVSDRWCMVHVTQMTENETVRLARSGAIAGLCPITEGSLGDGIFDGERFIEAGGRFGIGTDSNIAISLAHELRGLEYSQRLELKRRAVFATPQKSTGRLLFDEICAAGSSVANRHSGQIAPGYLADLFSLTTEQTNLEGLAGDMLLDSFIFAGGDTCISDVWSAGRHVVKAGRHIDRLRIAARYRNTRLALMETL